MYARELGLVLHNGVSFPSRRKNSAASCVKQFAIGEIAGAIRSLSRTARQQMALGAWREQPHNAASAGGRNASQLLSTLQRQTVYTDDAGGGGGDV